MTEWYNSLTQLQRVFALIAIPSTLILVLQTLLLFMGIGDGDANGDGVPDIHSGDGLTLFSVRGIIAMLCVGGWLGIVLLDTAMNSALAVVLAFIGGLAALIGMAMLIRLLLKLQSMGNIQIANAIGKVGSVYLTIPGGMTGTGKINITVQDTFTEFSAMTSETDDIKTGEAVRVVSTDETGILVVERLKRNTEETAKIVTQENSVK
jgi:hypothetical protein